MNKAEFVKLMAEKGEMTQKDAAKALEIVVASVKDVLAKGDKVQIIGFGSFEVRERKERTVARPGTKEKIKVPATKVPVFKAGKSLKDAVAPAEEPKKASKKKK